MRQVDRKIQKIGQFPSLADIGKGVLAEFKSVLDPNDYADLYKGQGLAAHGVGIGSFVYLRRVLENLVDKRAKPLLEDGKIASKVYQGSRVGDRIKLLKDYLPILLVENTKIYGVLSKGVHES